MKCLLFFVLVGAACPAGAGEKTVTPDNLESLRQLIRPQADESLWAKVPWETSLKTARDRAIREDKPLLLWRSGGGDVLGRT
jgi:hypothetical protein